jgi:hypothetical protein
MDFDDIVIGSGLAALGATLGTNPKGRVLVIGNPLEGQYHYYDEKRTVPAAFTGNGGLGNDWHGVIPTTLRNNFGHTDAKSFEAMLKRFYPTVNCSEKMELPWLFVPWRSIRPKREFAKLAQARGDKLTLSNETVTKITATGLSAVVSTSENKYSSARVWVAAGALHTPALLENSFNQRFTRGVVSDHAFCYIGQVHGARAPKLTHTREGMFIAAQYDLNNEALYTLRPARFKFRQLDFGIELRAVFGLPTGNALAKIARRASPGLLTEAFYNRFGMFPSAPIHSVYAQVVVRDNYEFDVHSRSIKARPSVIRAATDNARKTQPFVNLIPSRMPDAHIPGIHLHHSLDNAAVMNAGLNTENSSIKIVDASTIENIGPDHHSFKMLLSAYDRVNKYSVE